MNLQFCKLMVNGEKTNTIDVHIFRNKGSLLSQKLHCSKRGGGSRSFSKKIVKAFYLSLFPEIYVIFCRFLSQKTFPCYFQSPSNKLCNLNFQNKGGRGSTAFRTMIKKTASLMMLSSTIDNLSLPLKRALPLL